MLLYRNIEKSELLRGTTIVIDGFTGFTPIQRRLTEKLMMMSKDMYITISSMLRTEYILHILITVCFI